MGAQKHGEPVAFEEIPTVCPCFLLLLKRRSLSTRKITQMVFPATSPVTCLKKVATESRQLDRQTPESFAASAVPQRNLAALPFACLTSLDNLHGIEPIAEALIKTLAGKARTGRLDELKALELLQQAILL
ncbi:hypothetical protein [Paraburkholderia sp. CNPSo 3076]|uniref:hypothetical protein n=1 Tax=Paraburkholderia sp. CNPSo 3076 TaxID=2940936 RepID=UPI003A521126